MNNSESLNRRRYYSNNYYKKASSQCSYNTNTYLSSRSYSNIQNINAKSRQCLQALGFIFNEVAKHGMLKRNSYNFQTQYPNNSKRRYTTVHEGRCNSDPILNLNSADNSSCKYKSKSKQKWRNKNKRKSANNFKKLNKSSEPLISVKTEDSINICYSPDYNIEHLPNNYASYSNVSDNNIKTEHSEHLHNNCESYSNVSDCNIKTEPSEFNSSDQSDSNKNNDNFSVDIKRFATNSLNEHEIDDKTLAEFENMINFDFQISRYRLRKLDLNPYTKYSCIVFKISEIHSNYKFDPRIRNVV